MAEIIPGVKTRSEEKRYFFGIKGGKIILRARQGEESQTFDSLEGKLVDINRDKRNVNGNELRFYDFKFVNSGATLILSVLEDSSVARSILNSLMSVQDIAQKTIKISPWPKTVGDKVFSNVTIYANDEKTHWYEKMEDLPKPVEVMVSGKKMLDNGALIAYVDKYVETLNHRIRNYADAETGEVPADFPEGEEFEPGFLNNGENLG